MSKDVITKIMVPVDGSEFAHKALDYAIRIAKSKRAKLVILHVLHLPSYALTYPAVEGASPVALPAPLPVSLYDDEKKAAEKLVNEMKQIAEKAGVDSETMIVEHHPSVPDAIIEFASKTGCDLIVMGTKGRTGIKRFLLGSVAESVVHHAHCPVLVVR